jgi:hypothetical protein
VNHGRPQLRGIGGGERCLERGQGGFGIGGGHGVEIVGVLNE